jgi:hypothetical protein
MYSQNYAQKNINAIRHLLGQQINSLGLWESDLRNYKKNQRYDEGSSSMEEKHTESKVKSKIK